MTSKLNIGELFMCGFDGLEPTQGIIDLIKNRKLGSVLLFGRNVKSVQQLRRLSVTLQRVAKEAGHDHPLFIAIDHEGGMFNRSDVITTVFPCNMAIGAINDEKIAYDVAYKTGLELKSAGINYNLAPVLDVNNNPANPVIGSRSYGEDANLVGRLGTAVVNGFQAAGVVTSVKHFPGHGDTSTDSHADLPVIAKTLEQMETLELIPFRRSIASTKSPGSVMVAHLMLPHIMKSAAESSHQLPSTVSREVIHDLLRKTIGYEGVIITDCLEMDAVAETVGSEQGAVMALQAGTDMIMISHTYTRQIGAFELVEKKLNSGELSEEELRASIKRVVELKKKYLSWDDALFDPETYSLGSTMLEQHKKLSQQVYDQTITLVRNEANILPLKLEANESVLIIAAGVAFNRNVEDVISSFRPVQVAISERHPHVDIININESVSAGELESVLDASRKAKVVIVLTISANKRQDHANLVKSLIAQHDTIIGVATVTPYDLTAFPELKTYICTYEYTPQAQESLVRVLFGEIKARGKLPVTLPGLYQYTPPHKKWIVSDYNSKDLDSVAVLWDTALGEVWPLDIVAIRKVLELGERPRHFTVLHNDKLVGFAATFVSDGDEPNIHIRNGHLALIVVDPNYQHQGIGTALHEAAMHHLREFDGVSSIQLGAGYPRFFCGVPQNLPIAQQFFANRGWKYNGGPVYDLIQDITSYTSPAKVTDKMVAEGIEWEFVTPETANEVFQFERDNFSYWLWTYQHHASLGDHNDLIIGRDGSKPNRPIVAATVIYTSSTSNSKRSDVPWQHESFYGSNCGGMACVGVDEKERGRGIGIGLVAYATEVLKTRGVRNVYIDWVEATTFYKKLGYEIWRSYTMSSRKV